MRHIKNFYYRAMELFSMFTSDFVSADYYAAKREENR